MASSTAPTVRYIQNPGADALLAKSAEMAIAMKIVADQIANTARGLAPVDTGALRDSIRVEQNGSDVAVVAGDNQAYYAAFVELGTSRVGPRPYLRAAAEAYGLLQSG